MANLNAVNSIAQIFKTMLNRIEKNELLYSDEEKFKQYLTDALLTCDQISEDIQNAPHDQNNVEIDRLTRTVQNLHKKIEEYKERERILKANVIWLEQETQEKPVREVIKVVVKRPTPPRDPFDFWDMPTLSTIAKNHIFRVNNDTNYQPEEVFKNKYGSILRKTPNIQQDDPDFLESIVESIKIYRNGFNTNTSGFNQNPTI